MIFRRLVFCFFILLTNSMAFAQENAAIRATFFNQDGEEILLRWAPSSPEIWNLGLKVGYKIEKYRVYRNGSYLDVPERILFADSIIGLSEEALWENLEYEKDDYLAIAAQCLFGEDLAITMSDNEFINIYSKVSLLESRYSYHLLACDMSVEAAKLSGLFWSDKNIQKDEKYLYRIYLNSKNPEIEVDTALVFYDPHEISILSEISSIVLNQENEKIEMKWMQPIINPYVGYYLYKKNQSNKSREFEIVNQKPFVPFEEGKNRTYNSGELLFYDSLMPGDQGNEYYIRGINSFGILGPPSEILKADYKDQRLFQPAIRETISNFDSHTILWDYPKEYEGNIESFTIEYSTKVNGEYKVYSRQIPPSTREFKLDQLNSSSYVRILAVGKDGNVESSLSSFINIVDDIPPMSPTNFQGYADTTGIIYLTWSHSGSDDLAGYRVFRSFYRDQEFIQLTNEPSQFNIFVDTVNLNTYNKTVYYKLYAVDQVDNYSIEDILVAVKLPDRVPPTPPVIKSIEAQKDSVIIRFIPSTSLDVWKHLIFRQDAPESVFTLVYSEANSLGYFADSSLPPKNSLNYVIVAVDSSGNESQPSDIYHVTIPKTHADAEVRFKEIFQIDERTIELRWSVEADGISAFHIFKKSDQEIFLIKTLPPNQKSLRQVLSNSRDKEYFIQVEYNNRSLSKLSKF